MKLEEWETTGVGGGRKRERDRVKEMDGHFGPPTFNFCSFLKRETLPSMWQRCVRNNERAMTAVRLEGTES